MATKKVAKPTQNEKDAAAHGMSVKAWNNAKKSTPAKSSSSSSKSSGGSAPSGYKALGDTGKTLTGDAESLLSQQTPEAQKYISEQDFGNELSSGEVKTFLNKWIDANNPSSGNTSSNSIPQEVVPASMQNTAIPNLPAEAYQTLVPHLTPGTQEYQDAMDKLDTSYFDVLQQQLNASTEQEQQAADYNWQTLKKSIETNLNVSLSNDSFQAWDQVQTLKNQFGQQGIQGSGMQNEAIDSYLTKMRRTDSVTRDATQSDQDAKQQSYYMQFATPDQVKAFAASNPDKAKSWGLVPSDEIKNAMTPAALKAKYPDMTDDKIQSTISNILDANGNYRSNLYQKYMMGSNLGANPGSVTTQTNQYGDVIAEKVAPSDMGYVDINAAKEQYKADTIENQNSLAAAEAARKLGSIQPTAGAGSSTSASGAIGLGSGAGVDTTLFNKGPVTDPNADPTKPPIPYKPIVVPGSMLSSAS